MAEIVGVHGIAQQFTSGFELSSLWLPALQGGLAAAGYSTLAQTLGDRDLRVAFFGDLFRPPGAMAAQYPPYSPGDVQRGPELDMLDEFYQAAVAQEPSLGPPAGAMAPGRVPAQVMVERLLRSKTFAGVAQRALIGSLKQVNRFLADNATRHRVLACVHQEMGDDTRVLIGHSLGSVVAYEYLCQYQPASVRLLVTLGSPLGIPNLVFDRLTPLPAAGHGMWPGTVANWVNVAAADDVVALRKQLAALFPGPSGSTLSDRLTDNGNEPHAVNRYLNARETGSALGDVLP
jgi:hypothetical protein